MVKLNADMKAGTDAATVTDVQVNHISQTIAKPNVMGSFLTDAESKKIVKCCKCKLKHNKGTRVERKDGVLYTYLCPSCGEESYYNCP